MTYRAHVPGILVQAKGLRGPKGDPGDMTDASTLYQNISLMTNYASITHTHGSNISGHNITGWSSSNGLTLSVAAPDAAANAVLAGDYVSLSTNGANTTISITGLQPAGAYLLTAAQSNHTHGNVTIVNTNGTDILYSSASDGFSLSVPSFITTAPDLGHWHPGVHMLASESDNYFYTSNNTFANSTHIHGGFQTSPYAGSTISNSSASNGLTLGMPAFITTAPALTHTHGGSTISGFNVSGTSSSNGLTLSVHNYIPLANSTQYGSAALASTFMGSWELEGNHTGGTTGSLQGGTFYLSGGDNITLSGNSNTIIISGNAGGGGVALGNTATYPFTSGSVAFAGTNITVNTSAGTGASSNSQYINLSAANPVAGAIAALGITGSSNAFQSGSIIFSAVSNLTVNTSADGASQYIRLSVADPAAAANAVSAGSYISLSVDGVSTQVNVTGLQPSSDMSNYIKNGGLIFSNSNGIYFGTAGAGSSTTVTAEFSSNLYFQEQYSSNLQHMSLTTLSLGVGYSTHTHGSNISFAATTNTSETNVRASSSSNGLTMVIPPYITTAAQVSHMHGSSQPTIIGAVGVTSTSNNWTISIPAFITTAAQVSHSHGNPTLSLANLSGATSSASNGLTISLTGYPATSFVNVSEVGNIFFVDSLGSNITWGSTSSASNSGTYIYATAGGGTGGGGGIAASIAGNSTSSGSGYSNITSGTMFLAGGNNITLSQNGAHITISGANIGGAQTGISGLGIAGSTYTSGTVILSAQTNITFNTSVNGGSQYIRFSVADPSTAAGVGRFDLLSHSVGENTISGSTIAFVAGNNITMSGTNGSQIRIDGAEGMISFVDAHGISWGTANTGNTTNITASITWDSTHSHGNPSFSFSNFSSSSTASGSNGLTIGLTANTAAAGGAGTSLSTVSTNGSVLLGGINSNGISLSVPNWITTAAGGTGGAISIGAGTLTATRDSIVFSDASGIAWGMSGSTITASYSQSTHAHDFAATDHTHSSLYIPLGNSTQYATSVLSGTFQTTGAYLTSQSTHTHDFTQYAGIISTGIAGGSATMNSSRLSISIPQGSLYFNDGSGLSFGATVSSNSTTITGSVVTSYLSASLMPLAYSSAFQTATLANTFAQTGHTHTYLASDASTNYAGVGSAITGGTMTYNTGGLSLNISANVGSVNFSDGSGVSWGTATSGSTTTVTASVATNYIKIGNLIFGNSNGHTFSSSSTGASTHIWIVTA